MKNVYLYIVFLLIGFSSYGQDLQNARWRFGDHASLDFLPNPNAPIPASSDMNALEGCASVSDQLGNLLFYTDGYKVFNSANQTVAVGLNGNHSSTQSAIIVPKPGNVNRYYIITIDGVTGLKKGLYYSEVLISGGTVSVPVINIALKNHLGVDINNSYNNFSEKLTATKHINGIDYWIVAQINDRVYSYRVDLSGIITIPEANTLALVNTQTPTSVTQLFPGMGCMKISPDGKYIGIAYRQRGVNITDYYGAVALGAFDSATGIITFNPNLITPAQNTYYGLEFSPQSKYLYFTTSKLYRYNIASGSLQNIASLTRECSLQRAINGKIYYTEYANGHNLGVVNDPDNSINPDFQNDSVSLGNGSQQLGLPQWVPWQAPCPSDLILVSTANDVSASTQDLRKAQNTITASNKINNGAIGIYHAGEDIVFKPGFSSANGSVFRAYIEGCSNEFEGLLAPEEEVTMRTASADAESEKELFTLYPNPTVESVTITSNKVMQNITVSSLDGFTLFQRDIMATSYELNVSNYKKGIYLINVITEDGEMEMKKLIKE